MAESSRDALIRQRYMHPGEKGEFDVWRRVANAWADNERQADEFFQMMATRKGFPNTPAIANAGLERACGSACFVHDIEDSLYDGDASITQTLADASRVHQYGGGTGFSFSKIRPKGSLVKSTGRAAPGPVSFLRGYSDWFKRVSQAGLRPAANMGILHIDHPDIQDWIGCKATEGAIPNFNISVALTDYFMALAQTDRAHNLLHPDRGMKCPPAKELWTEIIDGAWRNGEPGAFFIDTANKTRLHPEEIHATNPCGEVPLLPNEACVLGSINLAAHLTAVGSWRYEINWAALTKTVRTMVCLLDNIVDKQSYPLDKIRDQHHKYRKIGVGVMGYADALMMMGVPYGSPQAIRLAESWMDCVQKASYAESRRLAYTKGVYPGYEDAKTFLGQRKEFADCYRRNLCVQVIAPTGSISRLANCSFGIEPRFDTTEGHWESFILGGRYAEYDTYWDHPYNVTASEVAPELHVATQAAFQKYTDQAVSKTVNLPNSATHTDVADIYRQAWESGCKGITVYRTGSRDEVVIKARDDCATGVCAL